MHCNRVAAIQMVSSNDLAENLAIAESLIAKASKQNKLIVLPESFALYTSVAREKIKMLGLQETTKNSFVRQKLANMAKKYKVYLVGGTLPICEDSNSRPFAACIVFNDLGEEVARYNKIHLFDVQVDDAKNRYRESAFYQPGCKICYVDTPLGRVGLAVCYDLRFSEFFRLLFYCKVDIIVIPSAFTHITGEAHWKVLLRSRAIENQCYVVGANQGGVHSAIEETYGHSMICSPWGEIEDSVTKGEGIVSAEIDKQLLINIRKKMPIIDHCRFQVSSTYLQNKINYG